jgi:hypothetical protein
MAKPQLESNSYCLGEIMRKALIIMILLLGLFIAIGCVGNKPVTPNETGTPTERQNVTEITGIKEFTREELANYNGKNGKTYVACQGKVYVYLVVLFGQMAFIRDTLQGRISLTKSADHHTEQKYLKAILLPGL